jgi:hypothetical protein
MPWIVAGDPGRIAVAFYCSSVDGGPEDAAFQAPWYLCVNESTNALSTHAKFSQVHATSHPNHWGQICTGGIGCTTGGDRTLYDFLTARVDPTTGRLFVVFTQSNKISGTAAGGPSIDTIVKQKSTRGGTLEARRPIPRATRYGTSRASGRPRPHGTTSRASISSR